MEYPTELPINAKSSDFHFLREEGQEEGGHGRVALGGYWLDACAKEDIRLI